MAFSFRFLDSFRRWLVAGALLLSLLAMAGCRTVAITSEPSGARIRVDGEEVGETPLTCRIWQGLFIVRGEY
ncbi:MAG: PEGA domain-containing protein, partial [Rhodospirillales bacterium]|nr:PEGA domain-containing protein [Rhodospirillales bacterium]